jgi:hypothetical protein
MVSPLAVAEASLYQEARPVSALPVAATFGVASPVLGAAGGVSAASTAGFGICFADFATGVSCRVGAGFERTSSEPC